MSHELPVNFAFCGGLWVWLNVQSSQHMADYQHGHVRVKKPSKTSVHLAGIFHLVCPHEHPREPKQGSMFSHFYDAALGGWVTCCRTSRVLF